MAEVPHDWRILRPKVLFTERREQNSASDVHLTPSQLYGVIPQSEYMRITGASLVQNIQGQDSMKHVEPNDFVIHLRSFQGGIEWSKHSGKVSTAYTVLTPAEAATPEYFRWLLKSNGFIQELQTTTNQLRDGQSIKYGDFAKIPLPVPPPDEQRAIADFLDRETARIDTLIEEQQRLIDLLRERRQAEIDVSFEPDERWTRTSLKHCLNGVDQGVSPQAEAGLADTPGSWGVLKSGCANRGVFRQEEHKRLADDFAVNTALAISDGDLIVSRASGSPDLVGSAAIVGKIDYNLILSDKLFRLRSSLSTSSVYLYWFLNSRHYRIQVRRAISGADGLANNLPLSALRNFEIAVPPLNEQQRIAESLDEKTSAIDAVVVEAEKFIELARERRAALITAAVTGQIDVRDEVA